MTAAAPADLEKFRAAGRIAAAARDSGVRRIRPGASLREVTEAVEAEITRLGGAPAFPVQSSRNHVAAHYCASPEDDVRYAEGDLVKLDVGVHVDGCVADTAVTVDLGETGLGRGLVEAAVEALAAAIAVANAGVEISEVARAIASAIRARGFRPVRNLCGHGVGRWQVHCAPQVPNHPEGASGRLESGTIVAIEPFATDGKGLVVEKGRPEVFRVAGRPPAVPGADPAVLESIAAFRGLPFARRQLRAHPRDAVERTLEALARTRAFVQYPPLVESPDRLVAQAEHTIHIGRDGVEVLTRGG